MTHSGVIASINISSGGVPKWPVTDAKVALSGLENDGHNDRIGHGGAERAVCIYAVEIIDALRREGHPIAIGTAGENVTLEGIDWQVVTPGARLCVGDEVVLEVASYTRPCKTIVASFVDGRFVRISQKIHPGWSRVYARVLSEGRIRMGDPVRVIPAPNDRQAENA
jgi:MOSC domain-containing protein YiiM